MIEIQLPLNDAMYKKFSEPVRAYIVPDLAPHLIGATFAVHENLWWPYTWIVSHVETGCSIGKLKVQAKFRPDAVKNARNYLANKTQKQLDSAIRRLPKWTKR